MTAPRMRLLGASIAVICAAVVIDVTPATAAAAAGSFGEVDAAFGANLQATTLDTGRALPAQANGMAELPGGSVVFGGTVSGGIAPLIKVDETGRIDAAFYDSVNARGGFNGTIEDVQQRGGDLYVAGRFTSYQGAAASGLAKLSLSGDLDSEFQSNLGAGFSNGLDGIAFDGDYLLGYGHFQTVNGMPSNGIVRLSPDGSVDAAFTENLGASFFPAQVPLNFAVPSVEGVYVGLGRETIGDLRVGGLVRLRHDGSVDRDFSAAFGAGAANALNDGNAGAESLLIDGDDLYVGLNESTSEFNGAPASVLVRASRTGEIDSAFTARANAGSMSSSHTAAIALVGDRIVTAGSFSGMQLRAHTLDGSVDTEFADRLNANEVRLGTGVASRLSAHSDGSAVLGTSGTAFGRQAPLIRLLPARDANTPTLTLGISEHASAAGEPVIESLGHATAGDGAALEYVAVGMPPGLMMSSNGSVSGIPAVAGDFAITLIATHPQRTAQAIETSVWHVAPEDSGISVVSDPSISTGTPETWEVVVRNTGRTALHDIRVSDTTATVTCPQTTLDPDEQMMCTATLTPHP